MRLRETSPFLEKEKKKRKKKRFFPFLPPVCLFLSLSFLSFLPLPSFMGDPPKEKMSPQLRSCTTVFRALLRRDRATRQNVQIMLAKPEIGNGELHVARGASPGENLLGAMESRAESEWRSPNRRMCYAPRSRRASHRSICEHELRGGTHVARKYYSKLRNVYTIASTYLEARLRNGIKLAYVS